MQVFKYIVISWATANDFATDQGKFEGWFSDMAGAMGMACRLRDTHYQASVFKSIL